MSLEINFRLNAYLSGADFEAWLSWRYWMNTSMKETSWEHHFVRGEGGGGRYVDPIGWDMSYPWPNKNNS